MVINKVVNADLCTGCGICCSLFKEKTEMDFKGLYNRPLQLKELQKEEKDLFQKICPGIFQSVVDTKAPFYHDVWGKFHYSGIGYSSDPEIRHQASSGGVLSQIAIYLLESNTVSGIIHIGADSLHPLENIIKVSTTKEQVLSNSGSRYNPASPLVDIMDIIQQDENKKFALIGKPCDITALKQAQQYNAMLKERIPVLLSFFCAGTPSRQGVNRILEHFNVKPYDVSNFKFRGNGWPGETIIQTATQKFTMKYDESWGKVLGPTIQNRCKICADGIGENADIVSADIWEADEKGYPKFHEADGNGLVLARSKLGEKLIDDIKAAKKIFCNQFDLNRLQKIQPTQYERKCTILPRIIAWKLLLKVTPYYMNQRIVKNLKNISTFIIIKSFLGSLRRLIINNFR